MMTALYSLIINQTVMQSPEHVTSAHRTVTARIHSKENVTMESAEVGVQHYIMGLYINYVTGKHH